MLRLINIFNKKFYASLSYVLLYFLVNILWAAHDNILDYLNRIHSASSDSSKNWQLTEYKRNDILHKIYHDPFKQQSMPAKLVKIEELSTILIKLNYAKAEELIKIITDKNNNFLSVAGKAIVDQRSNSIWLHDNPDNLALIKSLINNLDLPTPQILLEARIVNVTKDFSRDLGINFEIVKEHNIAQPSLNSTSALSFDFAANMVSSTSAGLLLAKLKNGILLDLELSALESSGRGEIIARPKLIVANQQMAVIEAGEEVPYQKASASGATAVVFKKAVLGLAVKPQINAGGNIAMELKINQDMISPKIYNGVPTILTKEIHTHVIVENNQTIVLGGIYKQHKHNNLSMVPLLGSLPILGMLFRKQEKIVQKEELLIFITPKII